MATNWMLVFVHLDRHEYEEAERSIDAFIGLIAKRNPARPSMTGTVRAILRARLDIARGRPEAALETLKAAEALYRRPGSGHQGGIFVPMDEHEGGGDIGRGTRRRSDRRREKSSLSGSCRAW